MLNDEKVAFILRRYGHDCLTFWIGLLTKCDDGTLTMDEEIFADLCLLETKRYEEIRSVFIKRGLASIDDDGHLVVINWDEYQVGESTERVRRYRDKARNTSEALQERPCNANETQMERLELEGELEGEEEGEGERASSLPAPAPVFLDQEQKEREEGTTATPSAIVEEWHAALSAFAHTAVEPPPKAASWAAAVMSVCHGDMDQARRLQREYFEHWRDLWFATSKGDKGKPADARAPDFDFRAYCANIVTIAARVAASAPPPRRESAPDLEPPPTPEERDEAALILAAANARAGFGSRSVA